MTIESPAVRTRTDDTRVQRWQLAGSGPRAYERFLVPAFFAPCADQLLDLVDVAPGERVLDVACGTGVVGRRALARVAPGGTVTGIDVNPGMIAVASESAVGDGAAVHWRCADAAALPLPDAAFDVVCCQQGLQFMPERPTVLREMHRVLTPTGRLGLAVWRPIAHSKVFPLLVQALERHAGPDAAAMMRAPFAGPDRDELRQLVLGAGFAVVRCRIGMLAVRFPSVEAFLSREVASSPLAEPLDALHPAQVDALVADLEGLLAAYCDDDGLAFPMQTWLVAAIK